MPTDPTSDLDLPLSQSPPKAAQPSPPLKVSESSPRTANRLTLPQTFALGAWIKEHEQQAKDDPDTQAAQHAALDLGFTVTAANFTAARQALGIEKLKPTAPPTIEDRLLALETEIQRLNQQSVHDINLSNAVHKALECRLSNIEQTLTNHRAGFEDLLKRVQTLEQRFHPESDSTPLPHPDRMALEIDAVPSDTKCPTPSAN